MLIVLKKRGGTLEKHQKTKFEHKGIILAQVKKESLDLLEVRNLRVSIFWTNILCF